MYSKKEAPFNVITLAFLDRDLEDAFREDYCDKGIPHLRLDLIVGVFLYALFGIHDYWLIPDVKEFAWTIRYFIVCPLLLGVFVFTFSEHFRKVMQLILFIAGFAAGAGVVLMIVRASPPGSYMSYAGLLLILLFYFRLRFITASALTWSTVILYEAVALWDAKIPSHVLYSNTFILATFSITGMYMSYTLEQHIRSSFLLRRTIQERNDEIAEKNSELEREITEHGQAEVALTERMKFLRTLLDTIPNPIFYTDVHGCYAGCNKAYEDFFGQTSAEITGKPVCDLYLADLVHFSGEKGIGPAVPQNLRTYESILRHADGTNRNVLFSSATYADIEGNPAGLVGVVLDITDLKRAEDEKLRLELQLFRSQKMEAVGQLAGGMAHEFNNILTAILGYANLQKKNMADRDPPRFYVDNIIALGERAARLMRDILAFSRKQRIEPKPVDLNEIVKKSESLLVMMIGEDIELNVSVCDEPLRVMADADLMSQVLVNLAANARDAMSEGGLLSVNTRLEHMEREFPNVHGSGQPGTYGVISVSDAGIGMDPKTRERIFEPFFSTKEVGKGTGLGLSMVYGIINQHHGLIHVDSEFGKGTTFRIYLPVMVDGEARSAPGASARLPAREPGYVPADVARQPGAACISPYPSGSETVLVAEDNYTVRALASNLLQENGYTVVEATDGEDAIQKFMEHAEGIRLLLLDVMLPKRNGREVYDTVRKIRPDIKVIFMSGYKARDLPQGLITEEWMTLLAKPIPPGDLLRAVRQELDRPSAPRADSVGGAGCQPVPL